MNNLTRFTAYGLPTIVGLCFAWVGNRIIRNEKELKSREQELRIQLEAKSIKSLK